MTSIGALGNVLPLSGGISNSATSPNGSLGDEQTLLNLKLILADMKKAKKAEKAIDSDAETGVANLPSLGGGAGVDPAKLAKLKQLVTLMKLTSGDQDRDPRFDATSRAGTNPQDLMRAMMGGGTASTVDLIRGSQIDRANAKLNAGVPDQWLGAPPQDGTTKDHTVSRNETLASIAQLYGTSVERLARFNQIVDPSNIKLGTIIQVPTQPDAM